MKTLILFLLLSAGLRCTAFAQMVAEDAKGGTSILLNSSAVALNLSEAALSASWNNFRNLAIEKPRRLLWGLSAQGSNNGGLSELFNGGQFTPQSRISGFIGLRRKKQSSTFELLKRIREIQESGDFPNEEAISTIKQLNAEISSARAKQKSKAITTYLNTGINADNFRLYQENSSTALASRFRKVSFRGLFADLGLNYEYGRRWTFGASAGYERFNNLDSLPTADYTLTHTNTVGDDQLSTTTKYHAFQGTFIAYNRANIKTDALYFARISDAYRLVWNTLYTRWIFPLNESRIHKVIQAGTAINFYKSEGKFAGGLYLQSNDLFNHLQGTDRFHERLSFGIVAKYAFSSIMSRDFPK